MNKKFTLGTILTVTTGRLLTKAKGDNDNGIGDLYDLLGHMTNDSPFTHQLPRIGKECTTHLLARFPELENADLDKLDEILSSTGDIDEWLELCVNEWGMEPAYEVGQIDRGDHKNINPISELVEMMGAK